ncbi:hypothetical protein AIN02nite_26870 [Acetobacter indonesiensis]|uniref:Uncharacterized protein n=1 Tax=Acetobacter indonesiensis TaxID=104101 RepID=A0A6N3T634_9PROT|nr:hypothetical protein AIN02nite_26870 [Acetobacter indonesiensis]
MHHREERRTLLSWSMTQNPLAGVVMSGRMDPATGNPLPRGVSYRGPKQYMTRKMVDGRRVQETFSSAAQARH